MEVPSLQTIDRTKADASARRQLDLFQFPALTTFAQPIVSGGIHVLVVKGSQMQKLSDLKRKEAAAYHLLRGWARPELIDFEPQNEAEFWLQFATQNANNAFQKRPLETWQLNVLSDGLQRTTALRKEKDRIRCGLFHLLMALGLPIHMPIVLKELSPFVSKAPLRLKEVREQLIGIKLLSPSISMRTIERFAERGLIGGVFRKPPNGHWRVRVGQEFAESLLKAIYLRATDLVWNYLQPFLKGHQRLEEIDLYLRIKQCVGLRGEMPQMRLCDIDPDLYTAHWDSDTLRVLAVVDELDATGEKITLNSVATAMGISPATFKRRKYNLILRKWKTASSSSDFLEKDARAKRLYKNQVLEETRDDD